MQHDPKILARLNRIEGQVRGVARMVAEERYCVDIVTQIRAISAALDKVGREVLKAHAEGCIASAIASGDAEEQARKMSELIALLLAQDT